MALDAKTAIGGNLREFFVTGQQFHFCGIDLAFQQIMLGRQAEQLGKAPVKMERAEMHLLGDFTERWAAVELRLHEFEGRDEAGEFAVGLQVRRVEQPPIRRNLAACRRKRPASW